MKLAVISDVHSNLEALEAVRRHLDAENPDAVYFLGDAVGYGPQPNECLEILRGICSVMILGNHDAAAVGLTDTANFNIYARMAVEYTAGKLTEENRSYLSSLPYTALRGDAFMAHASPYEPKRWHYILGRGDAVLNFEYFEQTVCFVGHSHCPLAIGKNGEEIIEAGGFGTIRMKEGMRYIINTGSVGQPRDGDRRAALVLYDEKTGEISLRRVPYDVAAVQEKMVRQGLPEYLIIRLSNGY